MKKKKKKLKMRWVSSTDLITLWLTKSIFAHFKSLLLSFSFKEYLTGIMAVDQTRFTKHNNHKMTNSLSMVTPSQRANRTELFRFEFGSTEFLKSRFG
jgi:hypothetical protein